MISVTLNFTSIEAARAALLDISASHLVGAPDPKPVATAVSQPDATAASTDSSPNVSESVDYPTLQKAVFALAGKSREAAGAVAASFGVKTFKELPEDKWGAALVAVNAALAEAA